MTDLTAEPAPPLRRIDTDADVAEGLAALLGLDPRLVPIAAAAGPLPLRRDAGGFRGLARIVVAQQVSTASAAAIWRRLDAAGGGEAAGFLALDEAGRIAAGLSRAKVRTLQAVAEAVDAGRLDLAALGGAGIDEPETAAMIAALDTLPGIGPWTRDAFLMFSAGHPDIFPVGDVALRTAVAAGLGVGRDLPPRRAMAAVADEALRWRPWRSVAARLFWAYYRTLRAGRMALPP